MVGKPLRLTRHAMDRMLSINLILEDLRKIHATGRTTREGKRKFKIAGRTKKGVVALICEEYQDRIVVITVTKGR